MQTRHRVLIADARARTPLPDGGAHLVVTSPPYPMVEMWDQAFSAASPEAAAALAAGDGGAAWEAMHRVLDGAWAECARVLCPGGFLCVNVGDATRTFGEHFRLYPNHARVLAAVAAIGLAPLPDILWRKPTNAPNKFMGSGMLPAGAYVTYEHEYILIFRKGGKRVFRGDDKARRSRSAYFWEERNAWFSDLWADLPGKGQRLPVGLRQRSAAFPLEIPYRLISMYSLQGDVVLDPFAGTGTTLLAAAMTGRSSVGVELDPALAAAALDSLHSAVKLGNDKLDERLVAHARFLRARQAAGKSLLHTSARYGVPVMTLQERDICFLRPRALAAGEDGSIAVEYSQPPEVLP